MSIGHEAKRPFRRTLFVVACLLFLVGASYLLWTPGLAISDGRHDRGANGLWLSHGWLGGDDWFIRHDKTNEFTRYRDPARIQELADKLRRHHITDVFPHLCPAAPDGRLPTVNAAQVERFLDMMTGIRVIPWIGGPNPGSAKIHEPAWRTTFAAEVQRLITAHPRLAGVQLNVEPLTSGDTNFLHLLDVIRVALPKGKLLSIAAYPPPTWWHPYEDVHWNEPYFRQVARRSDQLAVMMYDAAQKIPKAYQRLMGDWTREVLAWSEGKSVLLGLPTYDDAGVGYHDPKVENLTNALLGIHRALSRQPLPAHYQGVAIYCDWETSAEEWDYFRKQFLNEAKPAP